MSRRKLVRVTSSIAKEVARLTARDLPVTRNSLGRSSSHDILRRNASQEDLSTSSSSSQDTSQSLPQKSIGQKSVFSSKPGADGTLSPAMQSTIDYAYARMFGKPLTQPFPTSRILSETGFPKDANEGVDQSERNLAHEQNKKGIIPDLESFTEAALQCGPGFYADSLLEQREKIAWAHNMYQKARRGANLGIIVLGRVRLEEGPVPPSNEEFPYMDKAMEINLVLACEDLAKGTGSIIGLETPKWSLLANDAWVLGGMHMGIEAKEKTEFHFASPLRWKNFWNDKDARMTLMAREVIQLLQSGYEIIRPNPKLEPVAVCVDEKKAESASLLKYK